MSFKVATVLLSMILVSGCTMVKGFPRPITAHSSIEQALLWQSNEKAVNDTFAFGAENERLGKQMKALEGKIFYNRNTLSIRYIEQIDREISVIKAKIDVTNNFSELFPILKQEGVIVNIIGDNDRKWAYQAIIETMLKKSGIKITKDSDYAITYTFKKDGISLFTNWILFFYMEDKLLSNTLVNVTVEDLRSHEIVFEKDLKGKSDYNQFSILLIFGPFQSTSLDSTMTN